MSSKSLSRFGAQSVVTQQSVARERELDEIIARWDEGERADALSALRAAPHLAEFRSAVVSLAYEEYCQRLESGETVDEVEFIAKFSPHDTALRKVLALHRLDQGGARLPERLEAGDKFLGYEIVDGLGRGAFSRVYLAVETSLARRPVVLKLTTMPGLELEALGTLENPYIVPVLTAVRMGPGGPTAIIMPFHGPATFEDLAAKLRTTTCRNGQVIFDIASTPAALPPKAGLATMPTRYSGRSLLEGIVWLLRGVAEGLSKAHETGYLHLDLKPSNILLAAGVSPMLADFNLSQRRDEQTLAVGGTVPYMAPEQLQRYLGRQGIDVTAAADVYSLGVIAHELLSGKHPYGPIDAGLEPRELAEILRERMQTLRHGSISVAGLNPSLRRLLEACLSIDPKARPSAEELRRRLTLELGTAARSVRIAVRRPLASASVAGAMIAVLAFGAIAWSLRPTPMERAQAAYWRSDEPMATALIGEILAVDPNHKPALVLKARIAIDRGKYDEADLILQPLIEESNDAEPKSLYGYALAIRRKWQDAIDVLQPLVESDRATSADLNNYAHALIQVGGRLPEAELILNDAKLRDVRNAAVYYNRGYLDLTKSYADTGYCPKFGLEQSIEAQKVQGPRGENSFQKALLRLQIRKFEPGNDDAIVGDLHEAFEYGHSKDVLRQGTFKCLVSHPKYAELANIKGDAGRHPIAKLIRPPMP